MDNSVKKMQNTNKVGTSKPFYDGWFDYHYCSLCGKKTKEHVDICPSCGAILLKEE